MNHNVSTSREYYNEAICEHRFAVLHIFAHEVASAPRQLDAECVSIPKRADIQDSILVTLLSANATSEPA